MEIVSVAELKIGMFVAEPDCSWSEFNFAFQGFVLSSPEQIDIFQKRCRFVYVDRSRSRDEQYAAPKQQFDRPLRAMPFAPKPAEEPPRLRRTGSLPTISTQQQSRRRRFLGLLQSQTGSQDAHAFARELAYIEPRYDELTDGLEAAFRGVAEGGKVDLHPVREGLRDIANSLNRNPDAIMWLLRLKKRDQYSFDHAMDVAVYMIMLGSHIGWRHQQLMELGLTGLVQDIGKIQLPPELLAKQEALTADEKHLIRSHVASSLEILYGQASLPQPVILTVARHHERWDGSGYPRSLRYEQIGTAAEIAGLADAFCAMLKDKPYRSALGHQEALEELHGLRGKLFGPAIMEQFVQCVGLYPIGTLVELSSGEVGVVIVQNRAERSRPRILIVLDAQKLRECAFRVIDLREPANSKVRIVRALPFNAYGLSANDYYLG